ncbi:MAG: spiro-SPASM protein [Treponema sp.]|jgi:spiro-SPASM protein|nr:spiro-SPASM protein [Treponema sp.]
MRALTVLYGGRLAPEAFEPVNAGEGEGKSAFVLALEKARRFPGTEMTAFLGLEGADYPGLPSESEAFSIVRSREWTKKSLLERLSLLSAGFDLTFFAWADCPLLDPALASALAERHLRYAAEYSYADGWPYGFAPELLAPGTGGVLFKILGDDDGPVERDCLFSVIQKDINAFDIETEISPVDLRLKRLSFTADSRRNFLLLKGFMAAGLKAASEAAEYIEKLPELQRTLPAYFNIQVSGACPQACSLCPWPRFGGNVPVTERRGVMDKGKFGELLDRIAAFAGDAVIGLSLWGELSLHPDKLDLIRMVLSRPSLALVIETSGIGWQPEELEILAAEAAEAPARGNPALPGPLSWILSLDAFGAGRYKEARGPGFTEATDRARRLISLFPGRAYVQAVRVKGFEDDIEQFYRSWKEAVPGKGQSHIIIQKYDDFCGTLPHLQASDLSPVKRQPCWHLLRDMVILLDGSVPCCREDLGSLQGKGSCLGNVFTSSLEAIWKAGESLYLEHRGGNYPGICAVCDEYYTYNF